MRVKVRYIWATEMGATVLFPVGCMPCDLCDEITSCFLNVSSDDAHLSQYSFFIIPCGLFFDNQRVLDMIFGVINMALKLGRMESKRFQRLILP
jgi:hypothetical protein